MQTVTLMRKAVIKLDGIDQHGVGCECALCNSNGKSYGAGVYIIPENVSITTDSEMDDFLSKSEANYRSFGPSEEGAKMMAQAICSHEGLSIFKGVEADEEKVYGIDVVSHINFKIETEDLLSYEFETKEDIYVDEAQETFNLFRLNYNKHTGVIESYVACSEDYDVCEYVSFLFEQEVLLSYFQGMESAGLVPHDNTEEYLKYYEEKEEESETEEEVFYSDDLISKINFKIETDKMLAYEFSSTKDIYIQEGDYEADLFRIEFFKETHQLFVAVAFSEDYDVSDDITHLCNAAAMLEYCINEDAKDPIPDNTEDYLKHCEEQEDK